MARLSFTQGIVRHQTDTNNNPSFLQMENDFVNLVISQDFTILAFIHGTKSYLYTESVTETQAWGPFTPGSDYWLYWDINKVTGLRTFGYTKYEPVLSSAAPTNPQAGQMWFDTDNNLMYSYNGASWIEVIRVFACKLDNGTQFVSMSQDAPLFTGTQAGLTGEFNVGSLVYGTAGNPIFDENGKFFTTEDVFTAGVPTGASLKVNNILIRAQALQPIASYHVVRYTEYNQILPAEPFTYINKIYGILEEDVVRDEIANVITEGLIFNEEWDWDRDGGNINDAVYIDSAGQIVLTPQIPGQIPVGAISGRQTILFSPGLYGTDSTSVITSHGALSGLLNDDHPQYLTTERGDIRYYEKTLANNTFAAIIHQHTKADITDFAHTHPEDVKVSGDTMSGFLTLNADPTTALHAATKQYVDTLFASGINWLNPIITSTLKGIINDPAGTTPNAEYDTFIVGDVPTGAFSGFAPGTLVNYDGTNWIDILPSGPVQIGDNLGIAMHPFQYPPLNVDPTFSNDIGKIITITNNTPGSMTWDTYIPTQPDAVFIKNKNSPHFGHSYTFSGVYGNGVYGTDYTWIEFQTGMDYIGGTNITLNGKYINVDPQGATSGLDADLWDGMQSNASGQVAGETFVWDGVNSEWINSYPARIRDVAGTTYVSTNTTADTLTLASVTNATLTSNSLDLYNNNFYTGAHIHLYESGNGGTNFVDFNSPDYLTADVNFTLPGTNGTTGQFLSTDGTGVTSWTDLPDNTCIIDGDSDTFISVGYDDNTGVPCTDTGNNQVWIASGLSSDIGGNITLAPGDGTLGGGVVQILSTSATGKGASLLLNDTTSFHINLSAPPTLPGNTTFQLPANNGTSGQFLTTDGNGITSWADTSSGGGSSLCLIDDDGDTFVSVGYDDTNNIPCTDVDNNLLQLQTGRNANENSGKIVLVTGASGDGYSSGIITINSGDTTDTLSGGVAIGSGITHTAKTGDIKVSTGQIGDYSSYGSVNATTGHIDLTTGDLYDNGAVSYGKVTGNITIRTGDTIIRGGSYSIPTTTGNITLVTGSASGKYNTGQSGSINIHTAEGNSTRDTQDSGALIINTGNTGTAGGYAGEINISTGAGLSSDGSHQAVGGDITIRSGNSGGNGHAGDIKILAGSSESNYANATDGSSIILTAGYVKSPYATPGKIELTTQGYNVNIVAGNITLKSIGGVQNTTTGDGGNIDFIPGNTSDDPNKQANVRLFRSSSVSGNIPELRFHTDVFSTAGLSKYVAIRAPEAITTGPSYRLTLPANDDALEDGTTLISNATGDLQFQQLPYDINVQGFGLLADGDIIGRYVLPRNATIKDTGHLGLAQIAPVTTDATFTVYSSTGAGALTSIGTITFLAGSQTSAVAGFGADVALLAGDVITVECTTASSIEDVTITLMGKISYI